MPDAQRPVLLRVVRGDDQGKSWELHPNETYTIGRSHRCTLGLADRTASGVHAQIECKQGVWLITDVRSSHGTRVNKQRILSSKPLFDRDTVQCGKTLLEFREYQPLSPDDLAEIDRGIELPR